MPKDQWRKEDERCAAHDRERETWNKWNNWDESDDASELIHNDFFGSDGDDWIPYTTNDVLDVIQQMECDFEGKAIGWKYVKRLRDVYQHLGNKAGTIFTSPIIERINAFKKTLPGH